MCRVVQFTEYKDRTKNLNLSQFVSCKASRVEAQVELTRERARGLVEQAVSALRTTGSEDDARVGLLLQDCMGLIGQS